MEEYEIAFDFLTTLSEEIAKRIGVPKVQIVMIPGNHDCSLKPENKARTRIINMLAGAPEDANEPTIVEICLTAQENYFYFMDCFESLNLTQSNNLYYEYSFQFSERKIVFRCLNTAWVSQLHEQEGTMVFPIELIPPEPDLDANIVVSMLHHPYNWLGNENARALRDLLESTSDIILTGHEHVSSRYQKLSAHGPVNEYLEGGVLQDSYDAESSHFSVVETRFI